MKKAIVAVSTLVVAMFVLCVSVPVVKTSTIGLTMFGWTPPRSLPSSCNPQVGGSTYWCDWFQYVQPHVQGNSNVLLGTDIDISSPASTCPTSASFSFTTFDARWTSTVSITGGGTYGPYTAKPIAFVISHVSNGSTNTATPQYVFTQECANQAAPLWVAGATYYSNDVVCYPSGSCGLQTGGQYYQNLGTGSCVSNGASGPTGDAGCGSWSIALTNAPPQQVTFGTYHGTAQGACLSTALLASTNGGVWDINTLQTAGCTKSDSLATLATGFPMVYQNAFTWWMKQVNVAVINHYASVGWVNAIWYLRFGFLVGGEAYPWNKSQWCSGLNPNSTTQCNLVFQAFVAKLAAFNEATRLAATGPPPFRIMGAFNGGANAANPCTWASSEAATFIANNAYLGSESLQTKDIGTYATGGGAPCVTTPPPGCSNDWCDIFNTYGSVGIQEMQLAGASCPGGTCSTSQSSGPLNKTLVFQLQRSTACITSGTCTPLHELFANDWLCAYDPNFTGGGGSYLSQYSDCQGAAYQAVISNAQGGLITKSGDQGKTGMKGKTGTL